MSAPWLTGLRMALRFGLPLLGILVVGRAIVLSIGGEISRAQFALGVLLMAAGFSARLVPKPRTPKAAAGKRSS
ncbi:hypothetical protein AFCDBAGC_0522 [Methylobacterium cerastii]|uniref:Uncharacterized protein n=1 Tax=Methylobacterium cerastii TaxID=932741 RepID=A0ABQ4QBV2_9HYPH|nr:MULTISPECIES: hypothetical protein [Methylobacterium]TXM82964.1 hypothetical protein FV219_27130 [Methylobacterium sp. WL122]TXM60022.1 hypothetical protein FV229_24315 [Methylobacterium sp. WL120]TXM76836.1 hypothetical protein FV226_01070 [Methylobacterium sp. WL12]TXM92808.1 hypothetical protein FV222_22995 [Methylobacterium sp. WL103]TXN79524.1 hypothetical protein FV234_20040 [Methylobacterium sp. WL8]